MNRSRKRKSRARRRELAGSLFGVGVLTLVVAAFVRIPAVAIVGWFLLPSSLVLRVAEALLCGFAVARSGGTEYERTSHPFRFRSIVLSLALLVSVLAWAGVDMLMTGGNALRPAVNK